jgi:deoxyribonuclease-4
MLLGAHMSASGGPHKALERAKGHGFNAMAMFVRNQRQWRAPTLTDKAVALFRRTRSETDVQKIVAHASYLVNLAGRNPIREKSIDAMIEDVARCDRLGIEAIVFHPGAHPDPDAGIRLVAEALNAIVAAGRPGGADDPPPRILLEGTAGQGNSVGCSFEHLRAILDLLEKRERFGVCLDTCHLFAAGYDVRTAADWRGTMERFDKIVGLGHLAAMHLNDSKRPLGARVDRHAHIGHGEIGLPGFRQIMNDRRLRKIPLLLETPKGEDDAGRDWDTVNAETLRKLAEHP